MTPVRDLESQETSLKTTIPAAIKNSATLQSCVPVLKAALQVFFSNAKNDTEETLTSSSDYRATELPQVIVPSDHEDHERASIALAGDLNTGNPARNTITKSPLKAFIHFLQKSSKNWIGFLRFVSTMLSFVFVIVQKGRNGWLDGAIILVIMFIQVIAPALRDYWKQKLPENTVRREIMSNIDESKKKQLQAELRRVITCSEVMRLVVSILITAFMILYWILDPDSKGKPKMFEESTSLAIYLIGAVQEFPLYLALAINYWIKEALCGDFMFLTTLISYGRCAYENIRKYIQLVFTMHAAWLSVSFVTAALIENNRITTGQFLWINFITSALGGLALLSRPATENLMQNSPTGGTKRLITNAMWRNIVIQAVYQTTILVAFRFKGQALLGIDEKVGKTIAFYSLALCQVFNIPNAREPQMKNVFNGIHQHVYFWIAAVLAVGLQEVYMLLAHIVAGDAILKWEHRAVCFVIGALCLVVDLLTKCVSGLIMDILIGWPFSSRVGTCTSMTSSAVSKSASVVELQEIISNNI